MTRHPYVSSTQGPDSGVPRVVDEKVWGLGSAQLEALARRHLVDGISCNGRFDDALERPIYVTSASGSRFVDVDGRTYIDYHLSNGSILLGHNDLKVRAAIEEALNLGALSGYDTPYHAQLGREISRLVPSAELVRFANTGSEATLVALRLARAFTGRSRILKFAGHFHGLHEFVLFNTKESAESPGRLVDLVPSSKGIPAVIESLIDVAGWNDREAVETTFKKRGHEYSAIICEPVPINAGCIPPEPGFLDFLRRTADEHGTVLIFDEILSGFRTGTSCMQGYFGVTPHISLLGKALTNGLPFAVIAGRRDVMATLGTSGGVAHAGTFTGFPVAVVAALACLKAYSQPSFFDDVASLADRLYAGLRQIFRRRGVPVAIQSAGSRFKLLMGLEDPVRDFATAKRRDVQLELRLFRALAARGVYFHHSRVGVGHHGLSAAHSPADIDETLDALDQVVSHDI